MRFHDTLLCDGIFHHAKHGVMHVVRRKHFFWILKFASELLENPEELFFSLLIECGPQAKDRMPPPPSPLNPPPQTY